MRYLTVIGWLGLSILTLTGQAAEAGSPYTTGVPSRDGIGKYYMGREISHVMGHRGAGWLERSGREQEERTDLFILRLPLSDTSVVADIGAGTGYFTFPVAQRVPMGKVYAVDIQPEMLAFIAEGMEAKNIANVEPVLGSPNNPNLPPDAIDLAFIVDAYHEFSFPREMGSQLVRALKPGGKLVLVEYRAEDPKVPIKPLHKMSELQAKKEMEAIGLQWIKTENYLPQQHVLIFEKPEELP
ncbi:MAG: class I SAM-dependent methyltransferase [Cellvibrionales bacterium]|jgi:ubiquinone/menaquinone biosynthesis C-methylase UbiE